MSAHSLHGNHRAGLNWSKLFLHSSKRDNNGDDRTVAVADERSFVQTEVLSLVTQNFEMV